MFFIYVLMLMSVHYSSSMYLTCGKTTRSWSDEKVEELRFGLEQKSIELFTQEHLSDSQKKELNAQRKHNYAQLVALGMSSSINPKVWGLATDIIIGTGVDNNNSPENVFMKHCDTIKVVREALNHNKKNLEESRTKKEALKSQIDAIVKQRKSLEEQQVVYRQKCYSNQSLPNNYRESIHNFDTAIGNLTQKIATLEGEALQIKIKNINTIKISNNPLRTMYTNSLSFCTGALAPLKSALQEQKDSSESILVVDNYNPLKAEFQKAIAPSNKNERKVQCITKELLRFSPVNAKGTLALFSYIEIAEKIAPLVTVKSPKKYTYSWQKWESFFDQFRNVEQKMKQRHKELEDLALACVNAIEMNTLESMQRCLDEKKSAQKIKEKNPDRPTPSVAIPYRNSVVHIAENNTEANFKRIENLNKLMNDTKDIVEILEKYLNNVPRELKSNYDRINEKLKESLNVDISNKEIDALWEECNALGRVIKRIK